MNKINTMNNIIISLTIIKILLLILQAIWYVAKELLLSLKDIIPPQVLFFLIFYLKKN